MGDWFVKLWFRSFLGLFSNIEEGNFRLKFNFSGENPFWAFFVNWKLIKNRRNQVIPISNFKNYQNLTPQIVKSNKSSKVLQENNDELNKTILQVVVVRFLRNKIESKYANPTEMNDCETNFYKAIIYSRIYLFILLSIL